MTSFTLGALVAIVADLGAITLMASFYFSRHRRRDLVLAFVAVNAGVLVVTVALASAPSAAGLGLGLFGILSIIRLRSDPLTHEEIAYYFTALALGLLAGLHPGPIWFVPVLSFGLVLLVAAADTPRLLAGARRQVVVLDRAVADEEVLRGELELMLQARVTHMVVQKIDFVADLTVVDVRSRITTAAHDPVLVEQQVRPHPSLLPQTIPAGVNAP